MGSRWREGLRGVYGGRERGEKREGGMGKGGERGKGKGKKLFLISSSPLCGNVDRGEKKERKE